jgi:hypothetical protein
MGRIKSAKMSASILTNKLSNLTEKKLILTLALTAIVFLSGCIVGQNGGTKLEYSNDVVTVEDYYVDNINPTENSLATVSFLVQNNGDRREGVDVEVYFFDLAPFTVNSLSCQNGEMLWVEGSTCQTGTGTDAECQAQNKGTHCDADAGKCYREGCMFHGIEPLDVRQVSITLKAPSLTKGSKSMTSTISYHVKYDYYGYRKADIPLIDGVTRKQPVGEFSQSTASYGPVELTFEPPTGSSYKSGGETVQGYWGVMGRPFELKMEFEDVGSSSLGVVSPVNISKGSVKLELSDNIQKAEGYTCHFEESGEYLVSTENVNLPKGRTELTCNFEMKGEMTQPEVTAVVMAEFSYEYKYTLTEAFSIQPVKESESTTSSTATTFTTAGATTTVHITP